MDLTEKTGFDWDHGNSRKNEKHDVLPEEVEQVFLNLPLLTTEDVMHSQGEPRFHAMGITNEGRALHVTFTLRERGARIRPISARPMSRNERRIYETETHS
jgi:uncharacterized protein